MLDIFEDLGCPCMMQAAPGDLPGQAAELQAERLRAVDVQLLGAEVH